MLNKIKKDNKGFTIIEVLIVLAIAGLIMLVVFLAVPALQRSSRNTQREADATKVTAAMTACISNRNGVVDSCNDSAELVSNGGLDTAKLQQLTTVSYSAATSMNAPGENIINFSFGAKCFANGSGAESTTNTRQGAVVYRLESTGVATYKCIDV
jgi:prepilin-type N-terminal cleavage/methylation domain-containing protein